MARTFVCCSYIGNNIVGLHMTYRSTPTPADLANGGMGQPRNAHHYQRHRSRQRKETTNYKTGSIPNGIINIEWCQHQPPTTTWETLVFGNGFNH